MNLFDLNKVHNQDNFVVTSHKLMNILFIHQHEAAIADI